MIAIIDYKAGNTQSLQAALSRMNESSVVTSNQEEILKSDYVILPGVGQAAAAHKNLLDSGVVDLIPTLRQPVLGICLGMQLMANENEEGNISGIGLFNENVRKFPAEGIVPHMGWNNITNLSSELFGGISETDDVYFAHSYYVEMGSQTVAESTYILPFSAAVQNKNFYGVQFHPEKSGIVGQRILKNFLSI